MAQRRLTFPCGHRGKGRFCHRCDQEERERRQREKEKSDLQQQRNTLESEYGMMLNGVPDYVIRKVVRVVCHLRDAGDLGRFDAQRMVFDRDRISIRLTRDYRLLAKDEGSNGGIRPVDVVTHEQYNLMIRNAAVKGW